MTTTTPSSEDEGNGGPSYNVHCHHYGDLDLLKQMVESVPRDVTIHVVDGRYANFMPEAPVLTPGSQVWCRDQPNVEYHAPPEDRLPFGKEYDDPALRPGPHTKGTYVNYEVLPPDEWTLQLDADETLVKFDERILPDLDPKVRYQPKIQIDDGRDFTQPRLWVPKHWTLWIDDCAAPRDYTPRSTPLERLEREWRQYRHERHETIREHFEIANFGLDRRPEYLDARKDHLIGMKRRNRAQRLARDMDRRGLNPVRDPDAPTGRMKRDRDRDRDRDQNDRDRGG